MSQKIVAYKLGRSDCRNWVVLRANPAEIGQAIANEIDANSGLSAEELGDIVLTPYETTQEELDALPEWDGWD